MIGVFLQILPVFLLIAIGCLVKRVFVRDDVFWRAADALVYYLFFPALLLLDVTDAEFSGQNAMRAIFATLAATLLVGVLLVVVQAVMKCKGPLFTSIFQGGVRYNSYVFIALSGALFGAEGVALSGLFLAYMIIATNVMAVAVMNHYAVAGRRSLSGVAKGFAKNPLIISALTGVALNLLDIRVVGSVRRLLEYLGGAAMPLSLLSVGAGFVFAIGARRLFATAYSSAIKLLMMPLCTFFFLRVLAVEGGVASVAMLYASVPCAGNAYILSRQMGGDSDAMASIVTWGTLVSAVTITLIVGADIP